MSASPPTKESNVDPGAQSPDDESMSRDPDAQQQGLGYEFEVKEQDRWLPIANVARIMKTALPDNAKIAKEAKECMQECVSEFISFITSEASEKCQQEKRKTVNGEDILFAMTSLGFENYSEALKIYLTKYRETQASRGDAQPNRSGPSDGSLAGPGSSLEGGSHITGDASTGGDTTVPGDYSAGPAGSPNHILAGSAVEGSDGFGVYPSIVGGHNGAAGGAY